MAVSQSEGVNPALQDLDPAIIAYRSFEAAEAVIAGFCKRSVDDIPDEMTGARHAAYLALMAAPATTLEGVASKLRASVSLYEASEIEDEALTVPLVDLERIAAGKGVRS
jgi:hypothetical protein